MSSKHGAIVVVGSGPGIGTNTAATFAQHGFQHVVLLSRNVSRLSEDALWVKSKASGIKVDTVTIDLSDTKSIKYALAEVDKKLEGTPVEVVHFNAARVGPSKPVEFPVEDLETDLRIAVTGLYTVAQWAFPHFLKLASLGNQAAKPALLVTSGLLWTEPMPALFSLSAAKAAQHNLVDSFYRNYKEQGVHCGLVVVGGVVSDDAKVTTAANVAQEFWKLYSQEKGQWKLDSTMLDPDYEAKAKGVS